MLSADLNKVSHNDPVSLQVNAMTVPPRKKKVKKVKLSCNRPWKPTGLWDVEDPTLSRQ
jgi:hypothetical protein